MFMINNIGTRVGTSHISYWSLAILYRASMTTPENYTCTKTGAKNKLHIYIGENSRIKLYFLLSGLSL